MTVAYATVKVLDPISGKWTVLGFYQGAILPDSADPDNVANLVRREYAEWVDDEPVVQPEEPVAESGEPPRRPHGNAGKAAWVEYAVARRDEGVSEDDARAVAEQMTKEDLVAEYGG